MWLKKWKREKLKAAGSANGIRSIVAQNTSGRLCPKTFHALGGAVARAASSAPTVFFKRLPFHVRVRDVTYGEIPNFFIRV